MGFQLDPMESENQKLGALINRGLTWCVIPRKAADPKPVKCFYTEEAAKAAETRKLKRVRTQDLIKTIPIKY